MAYTTPTAGTAGQVLTATNYNVLINDIISFRDNSGVVPDAVKVVRTTTLTHTTGANISWSSASYDTNTMWSAGSPTIVTIKKTGLYLVTFTGYLAAATTLTNPALYIVVNSTQQVQQYATQVGPNAVFAVSAMLPLVATDTVSATATYAGTGPFTFVSTGTDSLQTRMTVTMLGATS